MAFTESSTVEAFLRDLLSGTAPTSSSQSLQDAGGGCAIANRGLGWNYTHANQLPRQPQDVFPEALIRDALIRLSPEIADRPERAEEVHYKPRAIVLSVRSEDLRTGLIRANEELTAWL